MGGTAVLFSSDCLAVAQVLVLIVCPKEQEGHKRATEACKSFIFTSNMFSKAEMTYLFLSLLPKLQCGTCQVTKTH